MYVKFVKDGKTIEEVSISSEMIPFPTDTVVLEAGKFTVESREYDILDGFKVCVGNSSCNVLRKCSSRNDMECQ